MKIVTSSFINKLSKKAFNNYTDFQMKNPKTIRKMEIVLEDFKTLSFMEFFPGIMKLSLVKVNILNMGGLRYCD